jgi:hypothetical protein
MFPSVLDVRFNQMDIDVKGLDAIKEGWHMGDYARPRRFEIAAALNRLRGLPFVQIKK